MESLCWVKIANSHGLWWPGQKKDDGTVFFFTENNTIEVEEKDILPYDCPRKIELIERGNRRLKGENLENFKKDLAESQKICKDELDLEDRPKKKAKVGDWKSIFAAPKPPPPPGSIITSPKKGRQRKKKEKRAETNKYCCDDCDFSTDRLNLFTIHRRVHVVEVPQVAEVEEDKKETKAKADEILEDWKEEEEATEDFKPKPPPVCPMAAFDRLFAEKSLEPSEQPPPLHTFGTKQKAIGVVHPLEPEKESEVGPKEEKEEKEEVPEEGTKPSSVEEDENLVLVPVGNADGSVTLMVVQIDPDAEMLLLLDQ